MITVKVSARNSWKELDLGRINATVTLTPSGNTFTAKLVGDKFPAWEILRYPATELFPAKAAGVVRTIGTRDQTSIGDLKASASTCTSTGPDEETATNPMSC